MAASAWRVYNEAKKYLLTGDIDLNTSAMRMKLLSHTKSGVVSVYTRSTFASLTALSTNIKGTALRTITNIAVTAGASAKEIKFDGDDEVFTASGGNFTAQYAVIGVAGGKALAWCKLSAATIPVTSGNTLTITINAAGFFTLTGGVTV